MPEIVVLIMFPISVLLTIATFLLSLHLSLKTGCFSLISQFVERCMLQIRHDKHVLKIHSNKRKISCQSLKFSLKSLLFDEVYKSFIFIFTYSRCLKKRGFTTIPRRRQFSSLSSQLILIWKRCFVDNNETVIVQ